MKKLIAKFVLFIFGWKTDVNTSPEIKKCVMIAAPHTSNWDFVFTLATFWKHDIRFNFFIKDSYTKSSLGFLFKMAGAIGVDRSKASNMVEFAAQKLGEKTEMVLLVPAEGTRSYVEKWKTGFYHIAKLSDTPIALGYLDFKKKIAGVGPIFRVGNEMKEDFLYIQEYYKQFTPKHPEKYNNVIF